MTAPPSTAVRRVVTTGGLARDALRLRLLAADVHMNAYAERLFADPRFCTASESSRVHTAELTVADLGLPHGGTFLDITTHARAVGLELCPLELGPWLRMQFVEQPESDPGGAHTQGRAPAGSITVASEPLDDDDDTPKGFYLRRIDGVLWLRAYRASADHQWSPDDRLVFVVASRGEARDDAATDESPAPGPTLSARR